MGYQPRQKVEWRKNQRFEDRGLRQVYIYIYGIDGNSNHFSTLRTRTEKVLETLVFSPFNHLTRLVAREDFIIHCRRESFRSYITFNVCFCDLHAYV
jgi:hypothetical protein